MNRWDLTDVKRATKQRISNRRRETLNQAFAEAGLGSILFGVGTIAAFVISLTPAYAGDEMAMWRSAWHVAGTILLFATIIMYFVHRAVDV